MAEHKYSVVREHLGDKPYAPGDERIANPGDVSHLVPHVLKDLGPVKAEKTDASVENKAEAKPANKAEAKTHKKDDA